jgi:hypothetical protein
MVLLAFPSGLSAILGLPPASSAFYPSILGAVLLGLGLALFVGSGRRADGLGVRGAIIINLLGGGVLLVWLLVGRLDVPPRGVALLWVVAVVVLGLSAVEALRLRR